MKPATLLRSPILTVVSLSVLALFAGAAPSLRAQAVTPPPADDEIVELSVFEVTESAADDYQAQNTNSITGTKLELARVPISAEVFSQQFMEDFGFTDISDLLVQIAGVGPPLQNSGSETATGYQQGDSTDFKSFSIRGLTASNQRRDGFIRSDGTTLDNFDVESVEKINGPQSLLYGAGDAGGVLNFVAKRANFRKKSIHASARFDSENSFRYLADANIGLKDFAVRAIYMNEDQKFWRKNIGRKGEGYYATLAFRPLKSVIIRAQYRKYIRDETTPLGAMSYPASTSVAGRSIRLHMLREAQGLNTDTDRERYGDFWNWENADSAFGFTGRHFDHKYTDITANIVVSKNIDVQVRWGKDDRLNHNISATEGAVLHPDRSANPLGVWAARFLPHAGYYRISQRGPRVQGNFKFNLGRSSFHQFGIAFQQLDSGIESFRQRFYETDPVTGGIMQDASRISEEDAGRNAVPMKYRPVFSTGAYNAERWPVGAVVDENTGKTYRLANVMTPGWGEVTAGNPLGLNGSGPGSYYTIMETRESALLASLYSEWFRGKLDTMLGVREEYFTLDWISHAQTRRARMPVLTAGAVWDIIGPFRGYGNYSSNANTPSSPNQVDIFDNLLPFGKGRSWEAGFKFDLFKRRLSGAAAYYDATAGNIPRTLSGDDRSDIDPEGINERNGGPNYSGSFNSRGISLTLNARPLRGWQIILGFHHTDGMERKDVSLPTLYNDQFNVMPDGDTVAVRDLATGALSPHLVASEPGNPDSEMTPLTITMMKDHSSPYFARLDSVSGSILNRYELGLETPGVGTGVAGLPISEHQLGFVHPTGGMVLVKKAGDKSTGYATNSINLTNSYRFTGGLFRGLSLGLAASLRHRQRGYYYTDAADNNTRKLFYFPDHFEMACHLSYAFKIARKVDVRLRLNVNNLLDEQEVIAVRAITDGSIRFGRLEYTPRAFIFSAAVTF
ncbi:MAG: TonB-dependent receptor plug domain-containing protein [Opitutaceae bacterium]|jgi:outer membrane receptor protein involved in Fe transport|nr:TonB-dependent receptor plug domain-containing protein [Opitutaceae bacterium]